MLGVVALMGRGVFELELSILVMAGVLGMAPADG